jgi:flagellar hook-associated protein 1
MGSVSALRLGTTALLAQQAALEVTGHNIANVSTPGYSRQVVKLEAEIPMRLAEGFVGRGVRVQGIERVANAFLDSQVCEAGSDDSKANTESTAYSNIEAVFNALSGSDVSSHLNAFFNALQDMSTNVGDVSSRAVVVQSALALRDVLSTLRKDLRSIQNRLNTDVHTQVDKANKLIQEIADLNKQISAAEAGGGPSAAANDMRDARGQALQDLGQIMDFDAVEVQNGAVTVSSHGTPLVFYGRATLLAVATQGTDGQPSDKVVFADTGGGVTLKSGSLAGTVNARDNIIPSFVKDLDNLAGTLSYAFNQVHSGGVGLTPLSSVTASNAVLNPGDPLSAANLGFTPPEGTFKIQNGSFVINTVDKTTGQVTAQTIDIDLDGINPETTLSDPTNNNGLVQLINSSPAGRVLQASLDTQNRLQIVSRDANTGFYFGKDTSGVLATLGLNGFFIGHDAATLNVDPNIQAHPEQIAAGQSLAPGDNQNALALADVHNQMVFAGGTQSVDNFYQGIVARLGGEASLAKDTATTRDGVFQQLTNERQQVSGVSLDEEMAKMIQFQRSYQAAARFITTIDAVLQSLMDIQ